MTRTKRIDITGERYGRLTVLKEVEPNKHGGRMYLCKCDCGNKTVKRMNGLRQKRIKSCGCLQKELLKQPIDLTGQKFGRLTVLRHNQTESEKTKDKNIWDCLCECGNEKQVSTSDLRYGSVQSCGCMIRESATQLHINTKEKHYVDGVSMPAIKPTRKKRKSATGVKGVFIKKTKSGIRYNARIGINGKQIDLGTYGSIEDAKKARKRGEEIYHQPYLEKYKETKKE